MPRKSHRNTSLRRRSPNPGNRVLPPDKTTCPNSVRRISISVLMIPFTRQSCTPMLSDPICSGWNRHSGARYRSGPNCGGRGEGRAGGGDNRQIQDTERRSKVTTTSAFQNSRMTARVYTASIVGANSGSNKKPDRQMQYGAGV